MTCEGSEGWKLEISGMPSEGLSFVAEQIPSFVSPKDIYTSPKYLVEIKADSVYYLTIWSNFNYKLAVF